MISLRHANQSNGQVLRFASWAHRIPLENRPHCAFQFIDGTFASKESPMSASRLTINEPARATIAHGEEVRARARFEFGKNWSRFLALVDEDRIGKAANSLKLWLAVGDREGKSFLDIGSGSGLYSLAARRLGGRVHSFDYDPQSVACTDELKRRYFAD